MPHTIVLDAAASEDSTALLHPPAPATLEQTGLGAEAIEQLLLKTMHFGSDLTGLELARRLGLEFSVIESTLDGLKRSHLCEVSGGGILGGPSYRYRITDAGRRRALLLLEQSHYVGVAPVPLEQYRRYLDLYRRNVRTLVNRAAMRKALSHLVVSDTVLDQVGLAVAGGHSMFVYGPPGNGKTVIAQAIGNLLTGEIAIPHAIEVEGQIIRLFDPVNHQPLEDADTQEGLGTHGRRDARWVRCRRPTMMVGGELTLQSLDLTYAPSAGFYSAPIQMLAAGGILVIDDFGRQQCSPRELLNRWIVPLESRVDFLTLHTGRKFDVPFMAMVVFATNMNPSDLVDEAFLRRVQYKVRAENPTADDFTRIFERYCADRGITFDRRHAEHLITHCLRPRGIPLRGCLPRDLINQALAHAEYADAPRELTTELLDAACNGYFVDDRDASSPA